MEFNHFSVKEFQVVYGFWTLANGGWPRRADYSSAAALSIAAKLRSTSSVVVAHDDTLMRIAVFPCHTVEPHQQVPSACSRAMVRSVFSGVPKETST